MVQENLSVDPQTIWPVVTNLILCFRFCYFVSCLFVLFCCNAHVGVQRKQKLKSSLCYESTDVYMIIIMLIVIMLSSFVVQYP